MATPDYLSRADLLALDIEPDEADAVLARSGTTGDRGQAIVAADQLPDLLALIRRERGEPS
jgi:hypothetical protein